MSRVTLDLEPVSRSKEFHGLFNGCVSKHKYVIWNFPYELYFHKLIFYNQLLRLPL